MPIRENQRVLREIEELTQHPEVLNAELELGGLVAETARGLAPKESGHLARSIHAEVAHDEHLGHYVKVGFDRDAFYGAFVEFGHNGPGGEPQPFLRPAAAAHGFEGSLTFGRN